MHQSIRILLAATLVAASFAPSSYAAVAFRVQDTTVVAGQAGQIELVLDTSDATDEELQDLQSLTGFQGGFQLTDNDIGITLGDPATPDDSFVFDMANFTAINPAGSDTYSLNVSNPRDDLNQVIESDGTAGGVLAVIPFQTQAGQTGQVDVTEQGASFNQLTTANFASIFAGFESGTITVVAAIPEPNSMLALTIMGLAMVRRRARVA